MRQAGQFLGVIFLGALLAWNAVAAERDVVLVLDNSGSMRVNDPARLSVDAVTDFIRAQDVDTRVGIVVFADAPRLVRGLTPVNFDTRDQLLGSLDTLDFSGQWTDTASAVERGLYELRLNGRDTADKAVILMTDGIIDTGNTRRDAEKAAWLSSQLAADAKDDGIRIFAIAFTEKADFQLLQSLAQATDGEYFRALRAEDISSVLKRIDRVIERPVANAVAPTRGGADFVSAPARTREPERIVYAEPVNPPAETKPAAAAPTPDAGRTTATEAPVPGEAASQWRFLLMLLALAVLGAVAASIFWGEQITRFIRKPRFRKETPDHGPQAVLYDVYDPSDIKRYELGAKPIVIGRVSGSDPAMDYIVVDERTVGRWHATIERRGQSFWIRDEGSVNGTFVNDQRVTSEHPLKHGDMVRVHRHEFEFVIPELFDSDRTMISPEAKMKKPDEAAEGV